VNARGLTLLETMVALVILGLVAAGFLEVFAGTARTTQDVETWTRVVNFAAEGMELAKADVDQAIARGRERLEPGFVRVISTRQVDASLLMVTVTVTFPNGGVFTLDRLLFDP